MLGDYEEKIIQIELEMENVQNRIDALRLSRDENQRWLETAQVDLREARIVAALDAGQKTAVKDFQKRVAALRSSIEDEEILSEALARKLRGLQGERDCAVKERNNAKVEIVLSKLEGLKTTFNETTDGLIDSFARISVIVKMLKELRAEKLLKQEFPELLRFPLPIPPGGDFSPGVLQYVRLSLVRGELERVVPFCLSLERVHEIEDEILS